MDDEILLRYSRHILLKEVGTEGQEMVNRATVLVVGCGGLGASSIPILAAAGVGQLILVDNDKVELSNLQRQVAYKVADIGRAKVDVAAEVVEHLNPHVRVKTINQRLDQATAIDIMQGVDVVLDCSDNYATRCCVNVASVKTLTPLVSGSVARFEAQFTVFDPRCAGSPCYCCLFGGDASSDDGRCAILGIFSPLVSLIGAQQSAEALKLIMRLGQSPVGKLMVYDALTAIWRTMHFSRKPNCPVCKR